MINWITDCWQVIREFRGTRSSWDLEVHLPCGWPDAKLILCVSQVLDPLRRAVGSDPRGLKGGNGRVGFISSAIVQRCMMWLGGRVGLRLAVVRPEEKNISIASHQGRCCFTMRALPVCQSVACQSAARPVFRGWFVIRISISPVIWLEK